MQPWMGPGCLGPTSCSAAKIFREIIYPHEPEFLRLKNKYVFSSVMAVKFRLLGVLKLCIALYHLPTWHTLSKYIVKGSKAPCTMGKNSVSATEGATGGLLAAQGSPPPTPTLLRFTT